MFHWICPECGREIPPKLKECPSCDPQPVAPEPATLASAPVVNAAAAPTAVPVLSTLALVPRRIPATPPAPISGANLNEVAAPLQAAADHSNTGSESGPDSGPDSSDAR